LIFSDRALSQKLERAEARSNASFVESRSRIDPGLGATWVEIGGAYAMFDGVQSPCTQTFGLGLFDEIGNGHLDRIEAFFAERGAPVFHEVSPMAAPSLISLLNERSDQPIELSSGLFRAIGAGNGGVNAPGITTRVIKQSEAELWAKTSAAGWATEHESLGEFMFNFGMVSAQCEGAVPYLAELDGEPVSAGILFINGDVAMLAGASKIPAGRNRGAQNALLNDRLRFAAEHGCTLAAMATAPGSQSQKNAQRNGFNIAYTRTKWQLVG